MAADGPMYSFFEVAPENNTSGGVPGGNICNAFLYNPDRVMLVGFESLTPDVLTEYGVGDLNTFEFTNDLTEVLPGTGSDRVLTNLIDSLTDDKVYTYNFEGNSQVLDHFLVSDTLLGGAKLDIVHVNVDFPRIDDTVGSDQEPVVARLNLDDDD